MNADFIQAYLRDALRKGVRQGGSTFIEELAESLPEETLRGMIVILQNVLKKKRLRDVTVTVK